MIDSRRFVAFVAVVGVVGVSGACGTKKEGDPEKSKAAFAKMAEVLTHARCVNCHPSGDSPTQGDAMTAHQPPVFRGQGGLGAVGMRCNTCHGEANAPLLEGAGSMPGAPSWHLAPASMAWQGKSPGEICKQLKDKSRNGNKSLDEIHDHMAKDALVGWAWAPGDGRSSAPGSQAELAKHTREWIDNGAHCPEG